MPEHEYHPDVEKHAPVLEKRFPKISGRAIRDILDHLLRSDHPDPALAEPLLELVQKHGVKVWHVLGVIPALRRDPHEWVRVLRESARLGQKFKAGFSVGTVGSFRVQAETSPHVEAMHAFSLFAEGERRVATMGFHLFRDEGKRVMYVTNVQGVPEAKPHLDRLRRETGLPWARLLGLVSLAHAERAGIEEVRGSRGGGFFLSEMNPSARVLYGATFRWLRFRHAGRHWVKRPPFLNEEQRGLLRKLRLYS